jgi:hypothetical protein
MPSFIYLWACTQTITIPSPFLVPLNPFLASPSVGILGMTRNITANSHRKTAFFLLGLLAFLGGSGISGLE